MHRRQLLFGLAAAGIGLEAQEPPSGSLYIPKPHLVEDRRFLHDFMDEFAFADLVTAAPGIRITHIPVLLDRRAPPYGTLYGHIARHNPQSQTFESRPPAVVVFHGPHSYISPRWYNKPDAVPTWNFAVVHASGRPQAITDPDALHSLLAKLIAKFEGPDSAYDFGKLPDSYVKGLMGGIIGFEMPIELLEGKFKLGQERSEADKQALLKNLETSKPARSIYEFTAAFYKRA
ncbi:MAG TPA: FMN-binding negative transcriptional regulator [Bryobacteraceae bacterium]|nr:FMN-binding negative transcriptional regulator [Bryobacteraceae bacterium]